MRDDNWDDLRIVLSLARTSSFASAARQLGVNESTVARRLAQAETRLCARLFDRAAGKLVPTEAGADLVRHAEIIELQVQAAQTKIAGMDERAAGTVRITAVPIVTNHILAPALAHLLVAHPGLQIDLISEPRDLNLGNREVDIALRLARPQSENRAIARRIATLDYAIYAAARSDPGTLPYIGYEETMRDLPQSQWVDAATRREQRKPASVRVNDAETLLHCLKAGLGKSLLPKIVGDAQPDLVCVPTSRETPSRDLWLMVHPDLRDLIRIKVTIDWLVDLMSGRQSDQRSRTRSD